MRPECGQEDCQRHHPEADEEPGPAAAKPGEMARLAGDGTQDAGCHAGDAGAEPTGASGRDRERAEAGRMRKTDEPVSIPLGLDPGVEQEVSKVNEQEDDAREDGGDEHDGL